MLNILESKWAPQTAQRQKAKALVEYNNSADHGFPFGGSIYLKVCKSLYQTAEGVPLVCNNSADCGFPCDLPCRRMDS